MNKIEFIGNSTDAKSQNGVDFITSVGIFDKNSQSFSLYRAVAIKSAALLQAPLYAVERGQNMNVLKTDPSLSRHEAAVVPTTRSDSVVRNDDLGQHESEQEPNEPAATDDRASEQTVDSYELKDNATRPDRHQKRLRAAEARRRLELLDEERELQDNLAEFWDSRFDKPRRWRPSMTLTDTLTRAAPPPEKEERAVNSHTPVRGTKNC